LRITGPRATSMPENSAPILSMDRADIPIQMGKYLSVVLQMAENCWQKPLLPLQLQS
jgi:hypothetical protein